MIVRRRLGLPRTSVPLMCKGGWRVPLENSSPPHTRLFHFNVMPFDLHGAPATFKRSMKVLEGCDTWEEHVQHLSPVLGKVRRAGLMLNSGQGEGAQQEPWIATSKSKGPLQMMRWKLSRTTVHQAPSNRRGPSWDESADLGALCPSLPPLQPLSSLERPPPEESRHLLTCVLHLSSRLQPKVCGPGGCLSRCPWRCWDRESLRKTVRFCGTPGGSGHPPGFG